MEILVKDGDTLVVVAQIDPSVCDPTGLEPAVANAYRIVASRETLQLIPLGNARRVTDQELEQVEQRTNG